MKENSKASKNRSSKTAFSVIDFYHNFNIRLLINEKCELSAIFRPDRQADQFWKRDMSFRTQ